MGLLNRYKSVLIEEIVVKRGDRQRSEVGDVGDLADSIKQVGLINPIVVLRQGMLLIAGERRLTACKNLGWEEIPVRFAEDMNAIELGILELEENLKRKDLGWRDQVDSIGTLHGLLLTDQERWSQEATAKRLSLEPTYLSMVLRVYRDLDSPRLEGVTSIRAAYNILSRVDEREAGDVLSDVLDAAQTVVDRTPRREIGVGAVATPVNPSKPKIEDQNVMDAILPVDFLTWVKDYQGMRFNLVHCDFPYGINVFHGPQGGGTGWKEEGGKRAYDDDPEIYWTLLGAFCKNLDRIMTQSGHLIFWFSVDTYSETLEFFRKNAPSLEVNPKPLIWMKSDNMGVLSDPKRGPRHIYETALLASRGDRFILRATSDAHANQTDKEHHPSTKPVAMLKYFFQMLVDENTKLFDPTCGSGSSLRAAEALGAKETLGLEINQEYVVSARKALKQDRILRKLSKSTKVEK